MKRLLSLAILALLYLWALGSIAEAQRFRPRTYETPRFEMPHGWGLGRNVLPGGVPRQNVIDPIAIELRKPLPNPEYIRSHLNELITGGRTVREAELDQLTRLVAGQPTDVVPVDPSNPNLLARVPADGARRPIGEFLVEHRLKQSLSREIDRDGLVLMPLLISKNAQALVQQINPGRQTLRGLLGTVTHGNFEVLDARMFAELRGKTLVVVGHVVERADGPAFEIRNGDRRQYLPLDGLQRVAKDVGFNVIPLGCETGEAFAVGTAAKITDVDGVEAFKRAISKPGRTSYQDLLSDIANENMRIVIDPRTSDSNLVPIELIDEDGTPVRRPPSGGGVPPSGNTPQNQSQDASSLNISLRSPGYAPMACEVSEATLAISYRYYLALLEWQWYLSTSLSTLLALYVIAFVIEGSAHGSFQPKSSETPSALRQFVIESSGNQVLAASIFDGVAALFFMGIVVGAYGWATTAWFESVVLEPGNSMMAEQPLSVVIFVLLLIPLAYFVGPYELQRRMLLVPAWIWIGIGSAGIFSLLAQGTAILFSTFAVAVTAALTGLPLLLHRAALDMNLKVTPGILLVVGCFLILAVVFGWTWFAGAAGCYLVEPRPL
jgi:hypothetical protein